MDKFTQIKEKLASLEKDAELFFTKGNKTAGRRLRLGLQQIKNLSQEVRVAVTEAKAK